MTITVVVAAGELVSCLFPDPLQQPPHRAATPPQHKMTTRMGQRIRKQIAPMIIPARAPAAKDREAAGDAGDEDEKGFLTG